MFSYVKKEPCANRVQNGVQYLTYVWVCGYISSEEYRFDIAERVVRFHLLAQRRTMMPKKKVVHRHIFTPRTTKEALTMVRRGWLWLGKKYPWFIIPLTCWMMFGGGVYTYKYMSSHQVDIKEAEPIGQVVDSTKTIDFSLFPLAYAEKNQNPTGPPIIFNGRLWGYEDTTLVTKAVVGKSYILVYDKNTKKVFRVDFLDNGGFEKSLGR